MNDVSEQVKNKLHQTDNSSQYQKVRGILSLLIVTAVLVGTAVFIEKNQELRLKAVGENASLELNSTRTVGIGETFTVPVMLNTDNAEIVETDVSLQFNTTFLRLDDIIDYPANSNLKTFLPQTSSNTFDKNKVITTANSTGDIKFGAVTFENGALTNPYSGILGPTNPLALLTFTSLQAGLTTVSFNFVPGSTTDSNLVKSPATDTLARVTNLSLTIGNASPLPSTLPSPSALSTPAPSPDAIPPTVSITNPIDGAIVSRNSTVVISASASDNIGVTKVEFLVSGSLKCTDTTSPYNCDWKVTGKPDALYTLSSSAYDGVGNRATSTISVTSSR